MVGLFPGGNRDDICDFFAVDELLIVHLRAGRRRRLRGRVHPKRHDCVGGGGTPVVAFALVASARRNLTYAVAQRGPVKIGQSLGECDAPEILVPKPIKTGKLPHSV